MRSVPGGTFRMVDRGFPPLPIDVVAFPPHEQINAG